MAAKTPIRGDYNGSDLVGFAEFQASEFIDIADGGTGATNASDARTALGLAIGSDVQAYHVNLADISSLAVTDGGIIVGDGNNFVLETGNTARLSLGLGTTDSPTFNNLVLDGNLTVNGTQTILNTETLTVDDNTIVLNNNVTGTPTEDAGIEIERGSDTNVSLLWDETNNRWTVGSYDFVAANFIGNVTGQVSDISNFDTGDLVEGSNLYYTEERVDDRVAALLLDSTTSGIDISYDDNANSLTISTDLTEIIESLQDNIEGLFVGGTGVSATYNDVANQLELAIDFSEFDSGSITEGSNLFFTDERVDDRIAALLVDANTEGIDVSYDDSGNQLTLSVDLTEIVESLQDNVQSLFSGGTGITAVYDDNANTLSLSIDFTEFDTDDLVEGTTNLFYTEGRFDTSFAGKSTTDLSEGTNLYYTTTRANTDIDARVTKSFVDALNVDADTLDGNDSTAFATAAQGTLADSAVQPGDNISTLTNDSNFIDLTDLSVTDSGGDGSLSYNNATGVITYTGPSQAEVLAHISGGTGITISGAGVIATTITQYSDADVQSYLSGGTGVTLSASGEFSIGQAVATTDNVTFNDVTVDGVLNSNDITAANISIDGNATITGNLTVEGTTTQVDSTTVTVADPLFKYAKDNTGNSVDIGFYGKYVQSATTKYAGLAWDASQSDKFRLFHGLQTEPTTTVDITATGHTVGTLIANLEGNVTGALTGNADTATALASGQNFSLTGDVTASAISFDGTGAVALSTSVTESAVTQHQAALAINESQITFTSNFLENLVEDTTPQLGGTLDANGNTIDMGVNVITDTKVGQWDTAYGWGDHSLAGYLTSETSHADVLVDGDFTTAGIMATDGSGTYSIVTDNSTNWNTAYGWGDHSTAGYLTSFTETNDLTAAVTWANVPDANITESSVTQHQAALSITESQISDLGSYITATSTDTLTNKTINFENNTAIIEFAVTVSNPGAGNKYYLDGELSANIQLIPGVTYRFDQSDASNSTHPLVLSTTSESAGVTSYTTGVTTNGTPGSAGAYTQIVVDGATADKLYYYCSNHSGMGGGIVSIQGSSFVAGTGISISGETISSTITQYADADVEAYLSGGTGVTFSSGVISIGQAVGTADNVTFNDLIVSGDLTVSGTTTTVNTETIELADNIIVFNSNETGTPSQDAGIEIERGTDTNKTLLWNETDDKWTVGAETFVAGTFEGNLTGDVTGDIDGSVVITAKNESGATIPAGVPVYISGQSGSGTEFTVDVADADGSGTMPAIGITTASASNNASVSILTFGKFVGLDTSSFSVGDELYISTTGTLSTTIPTGENAAIQKIAKVIRVHASSGEIFVQGAGRTNQVPNLNNGNIFIGNGSNQATTASFNTTVDGYLSGGTGIDYTTGAISVDSTVVTGQSALAGSVDTANDLILLYDNSTTSLTKVDVATLLASAGTGSFNDFNLAADTGTAEVVADGNTVTIAGGTGIDTVVSTTDTVTINLDSTATASFAGLTLTSTDAGSSAAPTIELYRDSSSPANADYLGELKFFGETSTGAKELYASITGKASDVTNGATDGTIEFMTVAGGTNNIVARLNENGMLLTEGMTLKFEGATNDSFETTLTVTDPTADRTVTLPDATGTVILSSSSIGDLSDVDITTSAPTDGQALVWNATNSEFEPGTVASSTNYFQTVAVSGQSDIVPDSTTDTLNFAAGANITLTTDANTDTLTIAATGGAANAFSTLAVAGQSNVVADSETDTLTLAAGTGMTITTDAGTDTITFESQGGGGGSLPVILAGTTSDPIVLSDITVAGAIPFTNFDGTTDNIQLGSTQTAVTTFTDNDGDTKLEVERTTDNDTVHIKAGGTDVITATSSGVTITNLTVTGTTTQANELKITDTIFELNADGGSLTTDAGMIVERGSTGNNASFLWDESLDAWVAGTTTEDGSASSNVSYTLGDLHAKTQNQGDNTTRVATTGYVDTALGSLSSNSITDADGDTKIQVEESSDEDIIRVDTAGQERLTIDNNVSMSARGGFFTHNLTMDSNETFTIAATEGTVAAGPLDVQGTVDVQGSLVVL